MIDATTKRPDPIRSSPNPATHRFSSGTELAQLPFFELRDGQITSDPSIGPIIDVHTHLALTYLRPMQVDLWSAPRPTEHYLPLADPLDLDVYANRNFSDGALSALKVDLGLRTTGGAGMRATHTVPNLTAEMDALGIVSSILLPIDFPMLSYNADAYLDVAQRCPQLISMGSVHPMHPRMQHALESQKARGAVAIKVHPNVQMIRPDHPRAMKLYRLCGELDLPVFWHCGPVGIEGKRARERCQLKHYWRAVHDHPQTTFILGHAGALQLDQALVLAREYENVQLEIACQGLIGVRKLFSEAPIERLMFGTDWPFYHQSAGVAKVMLASEGLPTERRLVFSENAARLFGIDLGALRTRRAAA